jgi:type IV pilus assembly protein PilB
VQAALTGHLVITTLHANNAFDVIARFTHMEIDLYELTAALNCIVAQRLLRKLCQQCRRPVRHAQAEISAFGLDGHGIEDRVCFAGSGCEACFGTGYKGRTVAAEILELTPQLKQMIVERRPLEDIRAAARCCGLSSMREVALGKAFAGVTSLAEVVRVT